MYFNSSNGYFVRVTSNVLDFHRMFLKKSLMNINQISDESSKIIIIVTEIITVTEDGTMYISDDHGH